MKRFVAATIRALGAVHGAVGVFVVPQTAVKSLNVAVSFGLVAFLVFGSALETRPIYRAIIARGYVLPLAVAFGAFLFFIRPDSDAAVAAALTQFLSEVLSLTPTWAYAAAIAYGAFQAQAEEDEAVALSGQPTYYR